MAGLYVHIPFCHSKCIYCDFYSTPRRDTMEAVVEGLIEEFRARRDEVDSPFSTIYLGGGTPSILPSRLIAKLLESLPTDEAVEITLEANPEDVTAENISLWLQLGINRVSIGVQALDDGLLGSLRRRHSASDAMNAIGMLRSGGISNISADLIYGLPGLTPDVWQKELRELFATGITHLSAYCLTYHEGTLLYKMWEKGQIEPASDEEIALQFDILRRETAIAGMEHYEISNFALPGYRSLHNSSYWEPHSSWLGIGPSAHSFDGSTRRIDHPSTNRWLASLPLPFEIEEESSLDLVNDNIVTSLRTLEGLDLATLPENYLPGLLDDARPFIDRGQMTLSHDSDGLPLRLAIHPSRWLISDSFIRALIRD